MSPYLLADFTDGCLTSSSRPKSVLSDVWNRFSALGLAGNHDSPTFHHTLWLLQFTLQMETGMFAKTPEKLCFCPRLNPESRFDAAFTVLLYVKSHSCPTHVSSCSLSMNAVLTLVLFSDIHNIQLGLCYQPSVCYKSHFCSK
jgi:hypothetical protein